mmetsp:Transcript_46156/g.149973  ORF Transcript_46156/g.149973 Transcript_46156/m.149973 type:complete len:258 (-) Transcript_46156:486-1259(-)
MWQWRVAVIADEAHESLPILFHGLRAPGETNARRGREGVVGCVEVGSESFPGVPNPPRKTADGVVRNRLLQEVHQARVTPALFTGLLQVKVPARYEPRDGVADPKQHHGEGRARIQAERAWRRDIQAKRICRLLPRGVARHVAVKPMQLGYPRDSAAITGSRDGAEPDSDRCAPSLVHVHVADARRPHTADVGSLWLAAAPDRLATEREFSVAAVAYPHGTAPETSEARSVLARPSARVLALELDGIRRAQVEALRP